ncbi:hypothetical protein BGX27_011409 [Mortierella sp. AM989]|nr:hypothetical protein BGX27_011409 [Mortierella sp. AM989]
MSTPSTATKTLSENVRTTEKSPNQSPEIVSYEEATNPIGGEVPAGEYIPGSSSHETISMMRETLRRYDGHLAAQYSEVVIRCTTAQQDRAEMLKSLKEGRGRRTSGLSQIHSDFEQRKRARDVAIVDLEKGIDECEAEYRVLKRSYKKYLEHQTSFEKATARGNKILTEVE